MRNGNVHSSLCSCRGVFVFDSLTISNQVRSLARSLFGVWDFVSSFARNISSTLRVHKVCLVLEIAQCLELTKPAQTIQWKSKNHATPFTRYTTDFRWGYCWPMPGDRNNVRLSKIIWTFIYMRAWTRGHSRQTGRYSWYRSTRTYTKSIPNILVAAALRHTNGKIIHFPLVLRSISLKTSLCVHCTIIIIVIVKINDDYFLLYETMDGSVVRVTQTQLNVKCDGSRQSGSRTGEIDKGTGTA